MDDEKLLEVARGILEDAEVIDEGDPLSLNTPLKALADDSLDCLDLLFRVGNEAEAWGFVWVREPSVVLDRTVGDVFRLLRRSVA